MPYGIFIIKKLSTLDTCLFQSSWSQNQNKWNISSFMLRDIQAFTIITVVWLANRSLKSAYLKNAIG